MLNCGNKEIINSIQNKLDKVSKESQNKYTQWLKKELCDKQKDFERNKVELLQQLGQEVGKQAVSVVKQEMTRKSFKLKCAKQDKFQRLRKSDHKEKIT